MSKAIKGCTNIDCKSYKKKAYKESDEFCPKCGKPLSYVCKDCWMELPDNSQKYCVRCSGIRKDKRDEWVRSAGEIIANGAKDVADFAADKGKIVSSKAKKIVKDIEDEKIRRSKNELKLPKEYKKTKDTIRKINFSTKNRVAYKLIGSGFDALVLKCIVEEEKAMDFEDYQKQVDEIHSIKLKDAGIIECAVGNTKNGFSYSYGITKHRLMNKEGIQIGNEYKITMNIKINDIVYWLVGSFIERGTTGMREAMVMDLICRETGKSMEEVMKEWSQDPYDKTYKEGFLMNKAEDVKYDEIFNEHPLTKAREFIKFVIDNN